MKIEIELPTERYDIYDGEVRAAIVDQIVSAILRQWRADYRHRVGREAPTEAALIGGRIEGIAHELVNERLGQMIEAAFAQRLDDGTLTDKVWNRIEAALDEPVDAQGRSSYRGTLKTRRIEYVLDKLVRAAIHRHVDEAAKKAVKDIREKAEHAFAESAATVIERLKQ